MRLSLPAALLALTGLALAASHRRTDLHPRRLGPEQLAPHVGRSNRTEGGLVKRGSFNGKGSFYEVGLGACGITNSDSDYIVALNFQQYGDPNAISPYCFKEITISYGGKSAQAQIVDACEACGYGGIDLSPSLFSFFASQSVGIIYLDWTVGGGSSDETTTTTKTKATTTSTWEAPTTTWSPSPTTKAEPTTTAWTPTSTWTPPPTVSVVDSTSPKASASLAKVASNIATALNSTSISSTHDSSSVGTNSTLASSQGVSSVASLTIGTTSTTSDSPAAPPTDQVGGNLDGLHQLVIQMGGMVAAAAQAQNA